MKRLFSILFIFSLLGFLISGDYQDSFERYYALGDSLTAGFQNGGLVDYYQQVSFPALIAKQAGVEDFALPLVSPPGIPPLLKLEVDQSGNFSIVPSSSNYGHPENLYYQGIYNNLGVPGATTEDFINTVSDNGGFHDLILRGMGTQLQLAVAAHPTLITLWIGNNDVLGALTSGKVIEGVTIVPVSVFRYNMETIVGALKTQTNAKIVMITIPQVSLIPFSTYIKPYIEVQGQKVYLIGPHGRLTDNDLVLLTAQTYISQGYGIPSQYGGTGLPLPDEVVVDSHERSIIEKRVSNFNSIIKDLGSEYDITVLDINDLLKKAATEGLIVGGVRLTSQYLTGGLFSLDGVHPSTIGYALIANEIIKLMNERFDWEIPLVNIGDFLWSSPRPSMAGKHLEVKVKGIEAIRR